MHLVKTEGMSRSTGRVGGLAGWLIDALQALWLEAKARREAKQQMYIIESLTLGGRKQLMLVSCAGEQFLVGTGAESVQTIVRVQAGAEPQERVPVRRLGERP